MTGWMGKQPYTMICATCLFILFVGVLLHHTTNEPDTDLLPLAHRGADGRLDSGAKGLWEALKEGEYEVLKDARSKRVFVDHPFKSCAESGSVFAQQHGVMSVCYTKNQTCVGITLSMMTAHATSTQSR